MKLTAPHAISGSGTSSSSFVYNFGPLGFVASATPGAGEKVEGIGLSADGSLLAASLSTTVSASYNPTMIGDHIIEAFAVDTKGATSRFGTSPIYIRVIPLTSSQEKGESDRSSSTTADASVSGRTFTVAKSGGNWNDPTTWKDAQGKSGVPGQQDLAIIGASTVTCPLGAVAVAGSVTLNGGTMIGPGPIGVYGTLTVSGGTLSMSLSLFTKARLAS